jgi:hypothetical protein
MNGAARGRPYGPAQREYGPQERDHGIVAA